jgi:hypothetical protein
MKLDSIVPALDAILKPLGFRRHKMTWNRNAGSFLDVADLQRSKSGDRVTVNVGVLVPSIFDLCWGEPPQPFVQEPDCTVRTRLRDQSSGGELWWRISDADTPSDLCHQVRDQALPFLDRMHSLAEMRTVLVQTGVLNRPYPPEALYLAALESGQGDSAQACTLLRTLRERTSPAWLPKVHRVMNALGCGE